MRKIDLFFDRNAGFEKLASQSGFGLKFMRIVLMRFTDHHPIKSIRDCAQLCNHRNTYIKSNFITSLEEVNKDC